MRFISVMDYFMKDIRGCTLIFLKWKDKEIKKIGHSITCSITSKDEPSIL